MLVGIGPVNVSLADVSMPELSVSVVDIRRSLRVLAAVVVPEMVGSRVRVTNLELSIGVLDGPVVDGEISDVELSVATIVVSAVEKVSVVLASVIIVGLSVVEVSVVVPIAELSFGGSLVELSVAVSVVELSVVVSVVESNVVVAGATPIIKVPDVVCKALIVCVLGSTPGSSVVVVVT